MAAGPIRDRSAQGLYRVPGMTTEPETDQTLDTCGLLCPLPVLKAAKRLRAMAPGTTLRMLADDPAARVDEPHFCAEQGHELVGEADLDGGVLEFVIRRAS